MVLQYQCDISCLVRRLGLVQARRLADAEFRPALFDEAAFRAVLPISREALDARLAAYAAEDQSAS